jgi:hypothetical protein
VVLMSGETPEQIAARLTAAQQQALLRMEADPRWQAAPKRARWAMIFSLLMDTDGRWWRLTPLGLAVRAALVTSNA